MTTLNKCCLVSDASVYQLSQAAQEKSDFKDKVYLIVGAFLLRYR